MISVLLFSVIVASSGACADTQRAVTAGNGETFCAERYAGPTQSPGDSGGAASSSSDSGASAGATSGGGDSGNGCAR